jgi:hypothetical protein
MTTTTPETATHDDMPVWISDCGIDPAWISRKIPELGNSIQSCIVEDVSAYPMSSVVCVGVTKIIFL